MIRWLYKIMWCLCTGTAHDKTHIQRKLTWNQTDFCARQHQTWDHLRSIIKHIRVPRRLKTWDLDYKLPLTNDKCAPEAPSQQARLSMLSYLQHLARLTFPLVGFRVSQARVATATFLDELFRRFVFITIANDKAVFTRHVLCEKHRRMG